ncbi:M18 family aminopeptidase [Kocuria coralli]|uniref:M18 family aminopeptidase n=1 Tax=Kocuria coralli TaxID=1461025 RepID=A0A5J5KZA5_9MICC|nr:M18 family aminopeptidase [Kocuria coralli]KAA9394245.1 M18 family aminopeptidase [Kocuria coralli]
MPADAVEHAEDLGRFVMDSPSSYHAVEAAAQRLEAAGFDRISESQPWRTAQEDGPGARRRYVIRDGALIAWVVPEAGADVTGFRILGAHTDSPSFKLKPRPSTGSNTWWQAGVEVYGGPLLNSWLDRELRLAGRLTVRSGDGVATRLVATPPVARIPQLAIHLDRGANKGLTLDPQQHVQPVWGCGAGPGDLLEYLGTQVEGAPVGPSEILGWDVVLADGQQPRRFGAHGEFLASGRLDNLSSVHAGIVAMLDRREELEAAQTVSVLAAFDHEEVGSRTRSGAAGPFLKDVLTRIGAGLGWSEDRRRAAWASSCLSSDAGHLVHPNYQGHHDPANRPVPGNGPLLKINADQHYTTDAEGAAQWYLACEAAGVPTQEFVSNNGVPCGSTIGPITATRLGIRTLDVGVGLLSMHSAREMAHVRDLRALKLAVGQWWLG